MWLFKICGMALIISACGFWGIQKSAAVKKRYEKILSFSHSLRELAERIRANSGEILPLLRLTFSPELIIFSGDNYSINPEFLKKEDCALLKKSLCDIGLCDITGEYNRILSYSEIIRQLGERLQTNGAELCKLYNNTGFMLGVFICIFFL